MALSVRQFQPRDATGWDTFVHAHPHGSPFHLTAWMKSIQETFGYQPRCLLAEEDGCLRAVLPLFLVRNLLIGKALISTPFAVYGGVLADGSESRQAIGAAVESEGRQLRVGYTELRNAHAEQCVGFSPVDRYVTFTRPIPPGREAILESIPRKTRAMVRKAFKYPLQTYLTRDPKRFEDLYAKNLRRLGTPCFPSRYFTNLLRHFGPACDILEVRLEEQVIAAVFVLYFRDQVLPYYGASDPQFNAMAPNNFMYYELMCQAGENGYHLYDFGRSKKLSSGSYDFKAHWGMQMRDLPYEMLLVGRKQMPHYSPNNPKFDLAIQLWQRVPLPITRAIGPCLIRLVP